MLGKSIKILIIILISSLSGCASTTNQPHDLLSELSKPVFYSYPYDDDMGIAQTQDDPNSPTSSPKYVVCESDSYYGCLKLSKKIRIDGYASAASASNKGKRIANSLKAAINKKLMQENQIAASSNNNLFPDISQSNTIKKTQIKYALTKTLSSKQALVKSDGVPPKNLKNLSSVTFYFNSTKFLPGQKTKLNSMYPEIKHAKTIWIVGFTDNIGPVAFNNQLALRRANAVRTYLKSIGGCAGNIKISGHGKCCYVRKNDSIADRSLNRRVEIFVVSNKYVKRMDALGIKVSPRPSTK